MRLGGGRDFRCVATLIGGVLFVRFGSRAGVVNEFLGSSGWGCAVKRLGFERWVGRCAPLLLLCTDGPWSRGELEWLWP
jgi:hypothetical protein